MLHPKNIELHLFIPASLAAATPMIFGYIAPWYD
ncbi:MAG: hypothetical protein ACI8R9_002831 [Paraglaciecola sp.]